MKRRVDPTCTTAPSPSLSVLHALLLLLPRILSLLPSPLLSLCSLCSPTDRGHTTWSDSCGTRIIWGVGVSLLAGGLHFGPKRGADARYYSTIAAMSVSISRP